MTTRKGQRARPRPASDDAELRVERCAKALIHGATLARIAASGADQSRAVAYLLGTLRDLRPALAELRKSARRGAATLRNR